MLTPSFADLSLLTLLLPAVFGAPNVLKNGQDLNRRAASCGVKGYDNGVDAFYYDDSGTQSTYAKCSVVCQKNSKCVSFGISPKVCMLFTVTVASNVGSDPASAYTYYDAACIAPASSTSAASSPPPASSKTSAASPPPASSTTSAAPPPPPASSTSSSTTTSQISTSTITTPSATSTSTTVSPPTDCPFPASFSVSYFNFFNSSHNLDCVGATDLNSGIGCFNSSTDGTGNTYACDPSQGPCQACTSRCATGAPLQPLGYGPPDKVTINIDGLRNCTQTNPQSIHRVEVGEGGVDCGSSQSILGFVGSSNAPQGTGVITITPGNYPCPDGKRYANPLYQGTISYTCTYDSGNNATCTTPTTPQILLQSFVVYNN